MTSFLKSYHNFSMTPIKSALNQTLTVKLVLVWIGHWLGVRIGKDGCRQMWFGLFAVCCISRGRRWSRVPMLLLFFQVFEEVKVLGLCVWPPDCEMNYSFEATGFWKRETGQKARGNRHSVWFVRQSGLFWFVCSAWTSPSCHYDRALGGFSHWIEMLSPAVFFARTMGRKDDREKIFEFRRPVGRELVIYSFSPWQLRIIKKKGEEKNKVLSLNCLFLCLRH